MPAVLDNHTPVWYLLDSKKLLVSASLFAD
jgi:hypothetical protein